MSPSSPSAALEFHEVDEARWPDLVRLMEGTGGPKHCWCLLWREPQKTRSTMDLAARREAMHERVSSGSPLGLLAYRDGEPVAWCSVAPRETYRGLGGPDYPESARVWSIVCFFLHRSLRGRHASAQVLQAAVDLAASHGADIVEAYPVDPGSPSYRFMGFRPTFAAAGFQETGMVGTRRHAMRLLLTSPNRA